MAGPLGEWQQWLPKPSEADAAKLRRYLDERYGGHGGQSYGLLGPTEEQQAAIRKQRGIPYAEAPSPMVSLGRGLTDLWEPVKQGYLNATDPAQAQTYRQQRAEDERLYARGLLSANPQPGFNPARDDVWRQNGQTAPLLIGSAIGPAMTLPQTALSYMTTQNLYEALNIARKRFGIGE